MCTYAHSSSGQCFLLLLRWLHSGFVRLILSQHVVLAQESRILHKVLAQKNRLFPKVLEQESRMFPPILAEESRTLPRQSSGTGQ